MAQRAEPVANEGLIRPGLRRERRDDGGSLGGSLLPLRRVSFSAICAKSIEKRPKFVFTSEEGGRRKGCRTRSTGQFTDARGGTGAQEESGRRGSRSHQKRLHPKDRHFPEPTLLPELERRAASRAGRPRGRMGRPHLEDPGPRAEPGKLPQCGQDASAVVTTTGTYWAAGVDLR